MHLVAFMQEHIRLELVEPSSGHTLNGIAFNLAAKFGTVKSGKPFDIVFNIEENSYNSNSVQLIAKDIKASEDNKIGEILAMIIRSKDDDVVAEGLEIIL